MPRPQTTILIVDDESSIGRMLQRLLRPNGFKVILAANGRDAVERYRHCPEAIDAVLLDVRMPDLDGPQTLRALQALNPRVRCCFMTGNLGGYRTEDLWQMGAAAVITKPLGLAEVTQTLRQLVAPSGPDGRGPDEP